MHEHINVVNLIRKLRFEKDRPVKKKLIGAWQEKDRLNDEIIDSFVVILRTSGCKWAKISGCSMCGYYNDTSPGIGEFELLNQLQEATIKYKGEKLVKIYTSGSFLDNNEISPSVQKAVLEQFSGAERVIVETRPEFINREKIELLNDYQNVMVAIGLESANDETLLFRINKGFLVWHYTQAAEKLKANKIPIKSYILLKPPFMTEADAITEAIYSIKFAAKHSDLISLNPMNIQKGTLVEYLWMKSEYRPPWLWSVVDVLKKTYGIGEIISYPTAGGTLRGAHNCGKCDERVVKAIYDFSLHQDISYLENLNCKCREKWKNILRFGPYFWDYTIESTC